MVMHMGMDDDHTDLSGECSCRKYALLVLACSIGLGAYDAFKA